MDDWIGVSGCRVQILLIRFNFGPFNWIEFPFCVYFFLPSSFCSVCSLFYRLVNTQSVYCCLMFVHKCAVSYGLVLVYAAYGLFAIS